jgi:putative addiction module killer protein
MDVLQYLTSKGESPFGAWFDDLDAQAAAKITIAVTRIGQGNLSNVKGVGSGVFEYRLNFGPGYRIYMPIRLGQGNFAVTIWAIANRFARSYLLLPHNPKMARGGPNGTCQRYDDGAGR